MSPPSSPPSLARAQELQSQGLYLSAHDAAMAALAGDGDSAELRHLAVLALARAGATSSALRLDAQWGLRHAEDAELSGLYPRLLKDIALGTRRPADAEAAAAAYAALWHRHRDGWHGINAAAMALLAGDRAAAAAIAGVVAALPDRGDYWSAATRAEAALLLGDAAAAAAWLRHADARAGADLSCRATTRRQLRWEAALLGADPSLADLLAIPDTIHFCGLIPDAPADEAALRAELDRALAGVGFAFGSLAAGGDIAVAEAALARGIAVTVILPFPADLFVERSVRPAGEHWVARFAHCLRRVRVEVVDAAPRDDLDYGLASRRAMGLARLHAGGLDSAAWQLALWDGDGDAASVAGTAADVAGWRRAGGATRVLPTPWRRKPRAGPAAPPPRIAGAVLFGDLPRFGTLDDDALAAFYAGPMAAMGRVVDAAAPRYRNAWGDAIQLVFEAPAAAAACALALRDAITPEALARFGLPRELVPRLALDYGGLHPVFDAVQGVAKFAGRAMTRAARIEPITPPGMIYATEAFACEIALLAAPRVACDYAGIVPTAKGFGTLPLYAVRPLAAPPANSA